MSIETTNDDVVTTDHWFDNRCGLRLQVDYSARCSFITDPAIKLEQCGLPKPIVLQLFRPLIVRRMLEVGLADFVEDAETLLGQSVAFTGTGTRHMWIASSACDRILEEVIAGHPVLLSRAPSLNRSGIQAFQPIITPGNVIRNNSLVFQVFDSEQDGDQATVHLPLSHEAQREAATRMMAANNLLGPASGAPVFSLSRDIAMGCYYVTFLKPDLPRPSHVGDGMLFASTEEVQMAHELGKVAMRAKIWLRLPKDKPIRVEHEQHSSIERITATTVGRVLFNAILPSQMAFYNQTLKQKDLEVIVADGLRELGQGIAIDLLERITQFGLRELTRSGCSVAVSDLRMAYEKDTLIAVAEKQTAKHHRNFDRGLITPNDRYNHILETWQIATDSIKTSTLASLDNDKSTDINPLFLMMISGAGISAAQFLRFAGIHGKVSKSNDELFEIPIKSNFREGLSSVEYFMSLMKPRRNSLERLKTSRRWSFRITGQRLVVVRTKEGKEISHPVPRQAWLRFHSKDQVITGEPLTNGTIDPNDVLSLFGEKAAQRLLLEDLWIAFSVQLRDVDFRHLEIVVSQMMRWLQVDDPGDSALLPGDRVDRIELHRINQALRSSGRAIATGQVRILGIAEVAKLRDAIQRDHLIAKNSELMVQASPAVGRLARPTIHASFKFTTEAFRVRHKQTIEMVSERTLLYTSESTAMVGRFDPVQQQVVVTPEEWDAFWEQIDLLDVWSWTNYHRVRRDGGKWTLELQRGDRQVIANGRNASPDDFGEFWRCLNRLVGGRLS